MTGVTLHQGRKAKAVRRALRQIDGVTTLEAATSLLLLASTTAISSVWLPSGSGLVLRFAHFVVLVSLLRLSFVSFSISPSDLSVLRTPSSP